MDAHLNPGIVVYAHNLNTRETETKASLRHRNSRPDWATKQDPGSDEISK